MTDSVALLAALVDLVDERAAQGDDLDRLATAVAVAGEVDDLSDRLVGMYVDRARAAGASWSQVGEALGVSKQAAQQRTVPTAFDRYTNRARNVVDRGQELARSCGQSALPPGLLLVATIRDRESLAARTLAANGTDLEALEAAILASLPAPLDSVPDRPGFTIATKQLLDQAVREALKLGHNYVGTEHLLLATVRQPEGLPAGVADTAGLAYDEVVPTVNRLLAEYVKRHRRLAKAAKVTKPGLGAEQL
jgi:Clp amino terminal domain, pathogenicity island component